MTLVELQNKLSKQIEDIERSKNMDREERAIILETSKAMSEISRQMIFNANLAVKTAALVHDGKIGAASVPAKLIG